MSDEPQYVDENEDTGVTVEVNQQGVFPTTAAHLRFMTTLDVPWLKVKSSDVLAVLDERDALRAEVERLRAVREAAARLAALWTTDSIYPDEQAALAALRAALGQQKEDI